MWHHKVRWPLAVNNGHWDWDVGAHGSKGSLPVENLEHDDSEGVHIRGFRASAVVGEQLRRGPLNGEREPEWGEGGRGGGEGGEGRSASSGLAALVRPLAAT